MTVQDEQHIWSSDGLLNKAQSYAEIMLSFPHADWQFAVWSTLTPELLSRAALSRFSPTLVADSKQSWDNLLFALNIPPKTKNFIPRSVDISEALRRLQELLQDFTPELESFCRKHMSLRNEELHSGATPFMGVKLTSWLPTYYRAFDVLLRSMDDSLERFLGSAEAKVARDMIAAARDQSAKSIRKTINAHREVWNNKSDVDKELLGQQSSTWATRQDGHRVTCPACNCNAILDGSAIVPPRRTIGEDEITEKQEFLPSRFECVACGLKVSGLPQLSAAGLGDTYNATFTYDANEYYASQLYDAYGGYGDDFNEY